MSTSVRRRLDFSVSATGIKAVVRAGFTLEDVPYESVDEALTDFSNSLESNLNSGAFDQKLKDQVSTRAPENVEKFNSVSSLGSTLSDPVQFTTLDVPTEKPTQTPAPTRSPTTGIIASS